MEPYHFQEEKDASNTIKIIKEKKNNYWTEEQKKQSLILFKKVVKEVPAYKDFLKKHKINPDKINNWQDFQLVPSIDKKNYLKQYPLEKLCWNGSLKKPLVFTSTSGSTGEPFYFPRGEKLDWQSSIIHELFLKQNQTKSDGPILIIVCFGMGVWIGGLLTYEAFEMASRRNNLPISILTPGINKTEIFKALKKIAPKFKQTILVGYPPFIKDIIDETQAQKIDLKKLNIRLMFAAEIFTEGFRNYVVKKLEIKNPYLDIMHIYGSADMGTMAFETGVSILIKKLALKNKKLFNNVFSSINKVPTLAQYNPSFINFEASNGEILLTGDNTIPLIRYAIGDRGGTFTFNEAVSILNDSGYNFKNEIKKADIKESIYELPFVYIYERADLSTTLYGLQIFPEMIREILFNSPAKKYLTGKFTLMTKFDIQQNQYLEINLELKKDKIINKQFEKILLNKIFLTLCLKSSEYAELSKHLKERALPKLIFWPAEHPLYFKPGIKQKWIQ